MWDFIRDFFYSLLKVWLLWLVTLIPTGIIWVAMTPPDWGFFHFAAIWVLLMWITAKLFNVKVFRS